MSGIPDSKNAGHDLFLSVKKTIKTLVGLILAFAAIISTNGCRLDEYLPEASTPFEIVVLAFCKSL